MKKLINIFLLSSVFTLMGFAQDNCTANLLIQTNEAESIIFIDSVFAGKGTVDTSLATGNYYVEVLESITEWGSEFYSDTLHVNDCGETYELSYSFSESILISSNPEDAAVAAKDSLLGYTPLRLKTGSYELNFSKHGYAPKSLALKPTERYSKVTLEFTGIQESEPFSKTTLFKVLIGSAVALGTTAAYFKLEADDRFDKYLKTRQQKYLDDTDQLDLYSGLAFGALQINFGALLYFFLIE